MNNKLSRRNPYSAPRSQSRTQHRVQWNGYEVMAIAACIVIVLVVGVPLAYMIFKLPPMGLQILTWGIFGIIGFCAIGIVFALIIRFATGQMFRQLLQALQRDDQADLDIMRFMEEQGRTYRADAQTLQTMLRQFPELAQVLGNSAQEPLPRQQQGVPLEDVFEDITLGNG